jgi:hypothetical protein
MNVESVDPRDCQWENTSPTYRVYFWEHPSHASDEWRITGATSVHEVLGWAHDRCGNHRTFQLWVETHSDQGLGLILLTGGEDPTSGNARS